MRFLTSVSHAPDEASAVAELLAAIDTTGLASMLCYYTQDYKPEILSANIKQSFPGIPFIGCSSCKGVMTEKGFHHGPVVSIMAIYDKEPCAYGSGLVDLSSCQNYPQAAVHVIEQALKHADRAGEVPSLIVLHATPGNEERFIEAIDMKFGTQVPIIGGSSADNHIEHQWSLISDSGSTTNGLAMQLFFPSKPLTSGFSDGYSPTEYKGTITKASGRIIYEIDGKPAKYVYKGWIRDHAGEHISEQYIFDHIARFPIGRIAGTVHQQPYYKLTHPLQLIVNGGLELFAEVHTGEEISLMTGSLEQLISRASRVVKEANTKNYRESMVLGAIIIHCGGSMLRLGNKINQVYEKLLAQMNNQPFICPFTFGEQGRFICGENAHGNLMISSVIFYESE
ncbi:histidine kinase [Vibrio sp. CAIM 722]|uniref:Histidine kinase n=2 Tax=Vibrio TaxID=662 RepID=A0A7X4RUF7_9VIBR|nr:FIST C-terminal domain-containing protein [Vibrio nitrifigilis]MZI93235.1 histidine kinase [Vibrio eleionomae]